MKRFRIDRIDVDIRGVSPDDARAAAGDLATAIRRQIARSAIVTRPMAERAATGNPLAERVARQVTGRIEAVGGRPADTKAPRS